MDSDAIARVLDQVIFVSGRGKIRLHRYAAEQKLGRKLKSSEIVHHIDGDQTNNEPSNLEILSYSDHAKRHWNERKK